MDRLGNMDLNIGDLFGGIKVIENVVGFFINNAWQPVFPLVKPLINDLVSTAFTDIFNDSFRYFPLEKIIKYWELRTENWKLQTDIKNSCIRERGFVGGFS